MGGLDLAGRRKDGTQFPVEISLSVIESLDGRLATAFVSDITERKRLEKLAETSRREIRALAARLLTAQEEERRRISRELHDGRCQQLASLAFDIGGLVAETPLPMTLESAFGRFKPVQSGHPKRLGISRISYILRCSRI